ncbi:MAG: hypothetical protein UV09_C0028G0001 [Candidatus Gottesmanbacteria bacterium GW2011_GWA2_42_18]|uniref:Uncharacterized protein n=1 Tax=Candidatus Gottesmanbacteria bacterium GW2011_GWA2_42_18 TaxID=1618442 RepID=A0A0G1BHK5_9BACT|nr:MAG: hypothetical protein UV09_C0028G0001 [Candidatus Gottesmanbacteria bacterium GW2011_GWA2_42_18]
MIPLYTYSIPYFKPVQFIFRHFPFHLNFFNERSFRTAFADLDHLHNAFFLPFRHYFYQSRIYVPCPAEYFKFISLSHRPIPETDAGHITSDK